MRKLLATLSALAVLTAAMAGSMAQAQEIKIGVVDMQEVMEKSEPGKKATAQIEEEFEKLKSELDAEQAKLEKMRQEMQKQRMALSQEAQIDKETEFKNKVRDFQDMYKTYQQKMQLKQKKLREPIIDRMLEIIHEFGQKNDFTMIVERQNSGVVFHQDRVDITQQIIKRLNAWEKDQKSSGNS